MTNSTVSPSDRAISQIESVLSDDLRLSTDEYMNVYVVDQLGHRFASINRDYQTMRFFKRESQKMDMDCRIRELTNICLSESKESIEVHYKKSDEVGLYYPQPETSFVDDALLSIIKDKPNYNGTLLSVEDALYYTFDRELLLDCLYFNELDNKIYLDYRLIGKSGTFPYLADNDLTIITQILEKSVEYEQNGTIKHPKVATDKVDKVLVKIAKENHKNPFIELIKSAAAQPKYDYKIESFLSDIGISSRLGNYDQDKKYIESVSCALFLSVIERQLVNDDERSIKFVPVIIGKTNLGKSTICKKLGLTDFYRESTVSIADEKSYNESVQGSVIVEQSEATHFVAGQEEKYKAHFDKNSYQYRKSYGRESIRVQKRYIEMITSNDNEILTDITGNIRYFPLFLDEFDKPKIPIQEHDNDMILSYYVDAYNRYLDGERWYNYIDEELQTIADMIRESVTKDVDGLLDIVDYLDENYPIIGDFVTRDEVRDYIYQNTKLDRLKVDKAIRLFGKSCDRYGFIKTSPRKLIINGKSTSKRGFERARETN